MDEIELFKIISTVENQIYIHTQWNIGYRIYIYIYIYTHTHTQWNIDYRMTLKLNNSEFDQKTI